MSWVKYIGFIFLGIFIGVIVTKNEAFISIMKEVNWSGLTFWYTLFLGATIPILINYFSIKRQEVIKLKAKLAQDKIDILREYKTFDIFMRATVILDKTISDLEFDYEPTHQDLSAPTIRGLNILENHEKYSEWKLSNMIYIEKLNGLGSEEISNYTWYMLHYILNVDILIEHIPDNKMWNVSVALKNDFINMSVEFSEIIDKYLNHTLYKFKSDNKKKDNQSKEEIEEKLKKTNLQKYKNQLLNMNR